MPGDRMNDEAAPAHWLEFVLAGRAERVVDHVVAHMPPEQQAAVRGAAEAVAALGLAEPRAEPSAGLRDRVLATLAKQGRHKSRCALVVCDMIHDNLTPGLPLEVPRARAIVPALAKRIAEARAASMPVVYVVDRHSPDDPDLDQWGAHAIEGTPGAEVWPALAPEPGDRIVTKPSFSGFYLTKLEEVLDELLVDTLVLTGCSTEVQVMATATDALQRGFAVELPADCQAGVTANGEQVALGVLKILAPYGPARRDRLERVASPHVAARAP